MMQKFIIVILAFLFTWPITTSAQVGEPINQMPPPPQQAGDMQNPPPPPPPNGGTGTYSTPGAPQQSQPYQTEGRMMPPPPPQEGSDNYYSYPPQGRSEIMPPMPGNQYGKEGQPGKNFDNRMPPPPQNNRQNYQNEMMRDNKKEFGNYENKNYNQEEGQDEKEMGGRPDFNQIKQQMRGMEQGLSRIQKVIAKLKAKGINVPSADEETIQKFTAAFATIKGATEFSDEIEAAMEVLSDSGDSMQEIGMRLGTLEQLPKVIKEAEKRIKQARTKLAKAKTKAEKTGANVSEIVARVETTLADIESSVNTVKSATGDNLEDAMETLREQAFESMEDLQSDIRLLENISNGSKIIKEAKKEISRIETQANRLKKQKKDVTELFGILAEMKSTLAEAETALKAAGNNPEELFEIMSRGESLHNDALEELSSLTGNETDIDKQFKVSDPTKESAMGAAANQAWDKIRNLFR